MSIKTKKKNRFWDWSTCIICLERPKSGYDCFVVFVSSHSKMYCSKLASPLLYIPESFFGVRVYIYVFPWHNIFLSFNRQPNTHLWVYKMDPRCCLYWQFPWYCVWLVFQARHGQKNCYQKCVISPLLLFLLGNIAYGVMSISWKIEAVILNQVTSRILFCILLISYVDIILEAMVSRVSPYPDIGVIFERYIYLEVKNWWMLTL